MFNVVNKTFITGRDLVNGWFTSSFTAAGINRADIFLIFALANAAQFSRKLPGI
jgi:hypothetical protein